MTLPRDNRMTGVEKHPQADHFGGADNSSGDGASARPTMRKAACASLAELHDILARSTCTVPEAGFALGLSRPASYRAAKDGSLPTIRVSGRLIVPTSALARMLGVELPE